MTGKEAFLALGSCILAKNKHYRDNDIQLLCLGDKTHEMISPQEAASLVLEELELGEKYKKVINFLKDHQTHLSPIIYFDTLEEFKKYYSSDYTKDVTEEIFNLVKEVFRSER